MDRAHRTDLHYAARDANVTEVAKLVASGCDVNAEDQNGWTALHFAAQAQCERTCTLLIKLGAKIDPEDKFGKTPLSVAVFNARGDGAVIRVLRLAGADPHLNNLSGVSPVMLARRIANFNVAQYFADLE